MKNLFLAASLLLTACSLAKPAPGLIPIKVWNNSLLPHQYAVIAYNPGEAGNWTNELFLMPGTYHKYSCPVGTKIYLADKQQADRVMSGGSISRQPPGLRVQQADAGKWIRLN